MLRLALLLLATTAFNAHPIHLGLTEVQYNAREKSLQVVHKFFVDDLEADIQREQKERGNAISLRLDTDKESAQANNYLADYLNTHFQFKVNGKQIRGNFIGKEYEGGAVWLYLEYPNTPRPKQLYVVGNALMAYHEDQNNIINLDINGKKGSLRFYKGHDREQISY